MADRPYPVTGLGTPLTRRSTWRGAERLVPMTGAVQAAKIRRRIRIPLRFADDYSTTATVVSFTGLTDAQQHVALELGRPAALHLTGTNAAYLATKARRGGHDLLSRGLERAAGPHRHAGPLAGPAHLGTEGR